MLFEEYKYFNYQFPEPQYLGAKHTHLAWIKNFISGNVKKAIDAFGGSQSVAFLFKQMGFQTITNDFLNFNHQIGLALIENPYKQALAFTVINRSMTRKVTMGHFGHTQALRYANDPERVRRNRSLIRPIKEIFEDLLPKYNNAVFDNKQENRSYNKNILELLPTLENIDIAYFDPPYCDSHADYQSFYHLLETFTEYWRDKQFINSIKRYEPQRYSGFDKKRDVISSFEKLFEYADEIPIWLISYNNRSYPGVNEFEKLLSKYRQVKVETKTYQNGRGGKGSVAGSQEILFICKPKEKHFISEKSQVNLIKESI